MLIPWRVSQFNLYRIIIFKACRATSFELSSSVEAFGSLVGGST